MQVKINKSSLYAPIRYEATRPYAVRLGQAYATAVARREQERIAFVRGPFGDLVQQAMAKLGRPNGPGPFQAEVVNVQVFGNFLRAGKVIFDLDPGLMVALGQTDIDNIPCGELPLPCDSFYLHFGHGSKIEGAYVTRLTPVSVSVDLVLPGWGMEYFIANPAGESLVPMRIESNDPEKPIQQAMIDAMEVLKERNAKARAQIAEVERQIEQQYGQVIKVPDPYEQLQGKDELMRNGLALVVNALFYLSAEPEDVIDDWGDDTPVAARAALVAATSAGSIKTLTNTLTKAGYRKVRFVGRQFAHATSHAQLGEAIKTGRTLTTHFRRGHFKRQAHGSERSLRKHIFIAPLVVNAGKDGEVQGRIYDVRDVREN